MVRPGRVIHSYTGRVPTATVSGGGGGSDVIPTANDFRTAWAYAGVVGGIPARDTVFTTLTGAQVTPANIATQLAACPSGQTVKIGPGTFNFSSKITLVNNKTLRGSVDANGVPTTILNCTSGGYSLIDFGSDTYPANGWGSMTVRVLTAAPAKGATSVTLTAAPTGLAVGDVMVIDAPCDEVKVVNSTTIEGGGIWGREGDGNSRTLMQFVKVTAIAGNVVTFANHPLLSDYWTTLGSVKAYWWTASRSTSRFVGLEDLQIRGNYQGDGAIISIVCAENCWVKNVICTGVASSAAGIKPAWSLNCEVRHCSVSDHESVASATYGLWTIYTGQLLAEDNIFFDTPCAIGSMSTSGSVFAYNMGRLFDYQQAGWLPECMMTGHGGHCYANLIEGNNIPSSWHDSFHGNASYCTIARNRLEGWQSDRTSNNQCINLWDNVGPAEGDRPWSAGSNCCHWQRPWACRNAYDRQPTARHRIQLRFDLLQEGKLRHH
jgi:hypothetical protein